jgi:hypothetical protein
MRKTRLRALREAFVRVHGRPPNKTLYEGERLFGLEAGGYRFTPSEVRRLKKRHLRRESMPATFRSDRVCLAAQRDELARGRKRIARKRRKAAA